MAKLSNRKLLLIREKLYRNYSGDVNSVNQCLRQEK